MPRTPPLPSSRATVLERLRDEVGGLGPSWTVLAGAPGMGKTALLRTLAEDDPGTLYYAATPLSESEQRKVFITAADGWAGDPLELDGGSGWIGLLRGIVEEVAATRRRLILILDDVPELIRGRPRMRQALAEAWAGVRAHGLPVHLVVTGSEPDLTESLGGRDGPLTDSVTLRLALRPLDYVEVAAHLPRYSRADRIRAFTIFGGSPLRVRHLDPAISLGANVVRAILAPDAPLLRAGFDVLRGHFQNVTRYTTLLRTLAVGARDWGEILRGSEDFDSGGQIAPYMARLEERDLIAVERSLDAEPKSRQRRYRVSDPFMAFWHAYVLPNLSSLAMGRGPQLWATDLKAAVEDHTRRQFPLVCRTWLESYAERRLTSLAREVGGLWGSGYDVDVGATLSNGAVGYGRAAWVGAEIGEDVDEALERDIRMTRYGFGRESRFRLLFAIDGFAPSLRRKAARDHLLYLVDENDLLPSSS